MDPAVSTFGLEPMSSTVSGPNVAVTLAQYVSPHGTRAFIITDAGINATGIITPITNALTTAGMKWQVFDQVSPNPTDTNVTAGVAAINKFGLDGTVVVLIGGGSVMDCGKYIALAAPNGVDTLGLAFAPDLDAMIALTFRHLHQRRVHQSQGYRRLRYRQLRAPHQKQMAAG